MLMIAHIQEIHHESKATAPQRAKSVAAHLLSNNIHQPLPAAQPNTPSS
jgi:hypothetical protein